VNYSLQGRTAAPSPLPLVGNQCLLKRPKLNLTCLLMKIAGNEECVRQAPCRLRTHSRLTSPYFTKWNGRNWAVPWSECSEYRTTYEPVRMDSVSIGKERKASGPIRCNGTCTDVQMTSVSCSSSTSQSASPEGEGCSSTCSSSKRAVAGTLISGAVDGPRGTLADRKATTVERLSSLDDVFDPYVCEDARS